MQKRHEEYEEILEKINRVGEKGDERTWDLKFKVEDGRALECRFIVPRRLGAIRANLWLLYLKVLAFSIVVKLSRLTLRAFGFQQVIQEKCVPFEVAGDKAAGFAGKAVDPCETCSLHPSWGVGFGAGVDIEGEAYCEKDATGKEGLEALEEFLLLWCAKADPDEVGTTGSDSFKNTRLLLACEIAML